MIIISLKIIIDICRNMPLSDRYSVKTDKIISDLEMETKINNGKQSKFNKALKEFNKGKSSWCIPKKDSKEYEKVMKIMRGLK